MIRPSIILTLIVISSLGQALAQELSLSECTILQKKNIAETSIYLKSKNWDRLPVDVALKGSFAGYVSSAFSFQKSGFYLDHIRKKGKDNWVDYTVNAAIYQKLLSEAQRVYFKLSPTMYGLPDKKTVVLFTKKDSNEYMVSIYNYYELKATQNN